MARTTDLADRLLARQGLACVSGVLRDYLRVPIAKARLSLATPEDFDVAVMRLSTDLEAAAEPFEAAGLDTALATLDVDWGATTATQRQELVRLATARAAMSMAPIPSAVAGTLPEAARRVVGAAKIDAQDLQGLSIGTSFTAFDERVMAFATRSETLFVRDAVGRRLDAFAVKARNVVAESLAHGLGRDDIRGELELVASRAFVGRSTAYWQVVAGAFVGRTRSYSQMGSYQEAGIKHYRVVAVMDERTSAVCRTMHGQVLSVAQALATFEQAENAGDAAAVKRLNPWPSRAALADSIEALSFPPYHFLCRTSTLAAP